MGRLQYISSTNGTFSITSMTWLNQITRDCVIEYKFLSTSRSDVLDFGAVISTGFLPTLTNGMMLKYALGQAYLQWYNGTRTTVSSSRYTLNTPHIITLSGSEYKWDGETIQSVREEFIMPVQNPTFKPTIKGNFYYFKVTKNGTDFINLVPWETNGYLYIKDLVSNTEWSIGGTWTAGPPVQDDSNVVPINKYKLYTSNIQKTYNGSTQINKMYVGNDLVYRACTIRPQLTMPLDEVWYKTVDNGSFAPKSNTYYIDSNYNQLTYTESFDSESGLWKMKFNGNVYGNQGSLYYISSQNNRLLELWLPYGFVRPNDIFLYGQDDFQKFKGDSPAIKDNGNFVVCLVQDSTNTKDYVIQAVKNATTITVPEGVLAINAYGFYHLRATTVNLPSTISKLDYASMEYTTITTLNCYATTPPTVDSMAWYRVHNNGTLHYPSSSDYSTFTVPSEWTKVGDL